MSLFSGSNIQVFRGGTGILLILFSNVNIGSPAVNLSLVAEKNQ